MSFINEIKTILKLDDKDWKKALSSISEAEKSYVKESKKNTEALINVKQSLSSLEQKKAKELEEINKQIAKAEENKTKSMKIGNEKLIEIYNRKLTIYRQERRELEANSKIEINQSKQSIKQIQETISTQDRYNKLLKIAKDNVDKYAEQESKNTNKTTLEQLKEKIALSKQESVVVSTQKQKDTFNKEQFSLYKQELAEKEKLYLQNEKEKASLQEVYQRTYINTKAQNQYADAVKNLTHMKNMGAISDKQYAVGLANAKKSIDENNTSLGNLANTTIRYLRWAGTIAGTFYAVQRAWDLTIGKGIEVNKMIEDNTTGIAALLGANTSMILSNGKVVNSYEKFQLGLLKSKEIMDNIRVAAKSTYATFPQLTEIYQQAIGQTLSFGTSFGKTVDDISNNTVKLAQRMSNIGGAIGQPMDRIKEEIRSLVSGNVSTDSIISTMIFGSPSQANEAIKKAKEAGTNGLKDMLDSYLKAFDVLEGVKTYTKAQLDLQDAISQTQGQLAEPTFNALKEVFSDLALQINKMKDDKTFLKWGENIVSTAKMIVDISDELAVALASFLGWKLIVPIMESVTKSFGAAQVGASQLAVQGKATSTVMLMLSSAATTAKASLMGLAASIAPMAAVMVVYEGYNWLIGDNIEKEERLKGIMSSKVEDLNKLSSSRLIYNKALLDEQLIVRTKAVQDAKAKVANKGLFRKSDIKQKEDAALLSTAQKDLEDLRETRNETSKILDLRDSILKKSQEINKSQKELGDLTVKLTRNSKIEEESKAFIKKEEEEVVKLTKQKKEWSDELVKSEKTLGDLRAKYSDKNTIKFEDIDEVKKQQEYIKGLKEGILQTDKAITEENLKKSKITTSEENKTLKQAVEKNKNYAEEKAVLYEIQALQNSSYETETYKTNMAKIRVETQIEEFQALDEGINKQKALRDLLIAQREYEKQITTEKEEQQKLLEKQNSFIKVKTWMSNVDSLDQQGLDDLVAGLRITYKDDAESLRDIDNALEKWQKKLDDNALTLKINFQGFDELTNGIATVGNSLQSLTEAQAEYNKNLNDKTITQGSIKAKQAVIDYQDATISSYANMAGAVANFYDEDDERRKKQIEVQKALQAVKLAMDMANLAQSTAFTSMFVAQEAVKAQAAGATAVAVAAQSSPWTGLLTAASMAAMLASFGIMLGGKTKTSASSDSFSDMKANEGTGTVLGDTSAQSESIQKSLEILENYKKPEFETLQSMNKYLANISSSIGGVSSLLVQSGGFAFGGGFKSTDSGWKNSFKTDTSNFIVNPLNNIVSKIPILGEINKVFGSAIDKVIGGIFGKTSVSTKLKDSGMYFADQLLVNAKEEIYGSMYQTIQTTTSKKSWFSKSTSNSTKTKFEGMAGFTETERQFSLILNNMYNATVEAGSALDTTASEITNKLNSFVVSIGKISLKGLSGEAIQDKLTAIFGAVGDNLAASTFPLLRDFQQIGEGMFTTMTRVATGMEEAEYYIERLGKQFQDLPYWEVINKQGDIGFQALLQSIVKADEAAYGLDNNLIKLITSLDSTAEELYFTYLGLDTLRESLKFLKIDADAVSIATIRGAGSIDALTSGISAYIDNFLTEEEKIAYQTTLLQKEFNRLNIAMPAGKNGFTALINSIDKTTESGQELFGRLIALSEGFAEVANSTETSIKTLEDSLKKLSEDGFAKFTDSLKGLFDLANELATSTQTTIQNLKYGNQSDNAEQLIRFNQLLKDFEVSKKTTNTEKTKSIYNEILSLSGTIGGESQYKQDIIGKLNTQLSGFNIDKDIIRVNVVDGLGSLINLSQSQLSQLQSSVSDGRLTADELNNISGLTQVQKDAILELSKNSNYFSTEATLSNLEEYSKLQLDAYRSSIAEETVGLSKSTLAYGDYIGKQEQMDIASRLGVSYESAKPVIQQLQSLSISKNPLEDIKKIVGFNGEDFTNWNAWNQVVAFDREHFLDIQSLGNTIWQEGQNAKKNRIEAEMKAKFNQELEAFQNELNSRYTSIGALQANYDYWKKKDEGDGEGKKYKPAKDEARVAINANNARIMELESSILPNLLKEKALKGYYVGGYTGDGAKYDVAGLVHKGEYVINQEKMKSLGGQESVRQIVGGSLQKSLEFLSAINAKSLAKLDIISQNFIELLRISKEHNTLLEASYIELRNIKGNTAP